MGFFITILLIFSTSSLVLGGVVIHEAAGEDQLAIFRSKITQV
jgi:hypothetical protein